MKTFWKDYGMFILIILIGAVLITGSVWGFYFANSCGTTETIGFNLMGCTGRYFIPVACTFFWPFTAGALMVMGAFNALVTTP